MSRAAARSSSSSRATSHARQARSRASSLERWKFGPPSCPHVATKPTIASIGSGQNHFEMNAGGCSFRRRVEVLEARDHCELDPDADGGEHLPDRLRDAADGGVVHDHRLELEPDAVGARLEPGRVEQLRRLARVEPARRLDLGCVPLRVRRDRRERRPAVPQQVPVDERLPVDRQRDRAPDADVPADALVVEAEVDERRLLELDQLQIGVGREPVDVEQRGVLEAVDLAALERRGALAVVEDRDPADPVEVGGPGVLLPRRVRAAVAVPAGDVEVRARDGLDERERAGAVAGRPAELLACRPPSAWLWIAECQERSSRGMPALGSWSSTSTSSPSARTPATLRQKKALIGASTGSPCRRSASATASASHGSPDWKLRSGPDPEAPDVSSLGVLAPRLGQHRAELAVGAGDGDRLVDRAPGRVDVRAGGVAAREVVVVPLAEHAAAARLRGRVVHVSWMGVGEICVIGGRRRCA